MVPLRAHTIIEKNIPQEFIGKTFYELHEHFLNSFGCICLGLFNHEENMGIADFLSSDSSVLDNFIKNKLEKAGHSLDEKSNINFNLNHDKNQIIHKGKGVILLK